MTLEHLASFLRAARQSATPTGAELFRSGGGRRVSGLRREEVARRASLSLPYYVRLEQGRGGVPSDAALNSLARALQLDADQRAHLKALATGGALFPQWPVRPRERPRFRDILATIRTPAFIMDEYTTTLGATRSGWLALAEIGATGTPERNWVSWMLDSPSSARLWDDWDIVMRLTVSNLIRMCALRPGDAALRSFVDDWAQRHPLFRQYHDAPPVNVPASGTLRVHHPEGWSADLGYDFFTLSSDPVRFLLLWSAARGTPGERRLHELERRAAPTTRG
ncbi:transcriptional regulator with XRE-family HTH domain [Diaminobutyricimonas aerilata]|uniref:Transcriptional regulator with XRE-family HTH domain n=1 Tax=Diaminobutyricimonas aerilata TaxID=1162967 RepID=A0A2M9CNW8_9MICO|nr:helix-turn-helix transcriptional regulator [Diaminobutyricimonas aerilata]PJJ73597.1 transcriptional regulator with XRE-family HTH domain [Diaminobutyricimonas aerilata]